MKGHFNDVTHHDVETEFLGELPSECFTRVLARAHFATGKLPQTCEMPSRLALGQENAAVLHEDPGHHEQCRIYGHGLRLARNRIVGPCPNDRSPCNPTTAPARVRGNRLDQHRNDAGFCSVSFCRLPCAPMQYRPTRTDHEYPWTPL